MTSVGHYMNYKLEVDHNFNISHAIVLFYGVNFYKIVVVAVIKNAKN